MSQELRTKIIEFHNSKIKDYNKVIADLKAAKDKFDPKEYDRLMKGCESDIQEAIKYTNDFFKSKGLKPI